MNLIAEKILKNGNKAVVVTVGKAGGGHWYSPALMRVVEIQPHTNYYLITGKNVVCEHFCREFNYNAGCGPDSRRGRLENAAMAIFDSL